MSTTNLRRARLVVATSIVCLALPGLGAASASASSTASFVAAGATTGAYPLRSSSTKKGLPSKGKKKPPVISGGVYAFPLRSS